MAENTNELNFVEAIEEVLKPLSTGDVVKGVVTEITPQEVLVDIGCRYEGVIPFYGFSNELTNEPVNDASEVVKVGDEIEVFVVHVSDRDGIAILSKKKIDAEKGLKELEVDFENKTVLNGNIIEVVKGGIIAVVKGIRVFIPASEAAEHFVKDLNSLLNTEAAFRIIEMSRDRRGRTRIVGSIKSVVKEIKAKKADEFWANVELNKKYVGIVKAITNFGVFVDLGGLDALLHISELSNTRIGHPSEVVSEGDNINVYIKEINLELKRVSLGYEGYVGNSILQETVNKDKSNENDVNTVVNPQTNIINKQVKVSINEEEWNDFLNDMI